MQGDFQAQRAQLLLDLRAMGLSDTALLSAFEEIPREAFVDAQWKSSAYSRRSLPIACGQDMTPIAHIARMLNALHLEPSNRVLELGTGSGYQTALLSKIARHVVGIDRYATLVDDAKAKLDSLSITNAETVLGDGLDGAPKYGPFDRVVFNFATDELPRQFISQMTANARLIVPLIKGSQQIVTLYTKIGARFEVEPLFAGDFPMRIDGVAKAI